MGPNYTATAGAEPTALSAAAADILTLAGLIPSDREAPLDPTDVRVYPAPPITNSVYVDVGHLTGDYLAQKMALNAAAAAMRAAGWYVLPVLPDLSFRTAPGEPPTVPE